VPKIDFAHTYIPNFLFRAAQGILVNRANGLLSTFAWSEKKLSKKCKKGEKTLKNT